MTRHPSHFFVTAHIPDGWECSKCGCGWHNKRVVEPCQSDTQTEPTLEPKKRTIGDIWASGDL